MYCRPISKGMAAQVLTALLAGVLFASPVDAQLPEVQPRQRKADVDVPPSKGTDENVSGQKARTVSNEDRSREQPREDNRELPEITPQASDQEEQEFKANDVFLGIAVTPTEETVTGVYVSEVALNGPADNAGVQSGDIILSVQETAVDSLQSFQETLAKLKPGVNGQIVVLRNERKLRIPIEFVSHKTAGFRPDESGEFGLVEIQEPKACLGVILTTDSPDMNGVTIRRVHPDCPAAAGLQEGDIIYSINKTEVSTPADVTALLTDLEPGAEMTLLVRRDGERQMVRTKLAAREELLTVSTQQTDSTYLADDEATGHQLMLEQHKHFAKQHERLENLTLQLLDEVKTLRMEVKELKNGQADRN